MAMPSPRRRISHKTFLIAYGFILLIGFSLTLMGFIFDRLSIWSGLFVGLGASCMATAVAGFVTVLIVAPSSADALLERISQTLGSPAVLLSQRTLLTERYRDLTQNATNIDITSMTLKAFLSGFRTDDIIEYIVQGKKFRILLLFPDSQGARVRQKEEPEANLESDIYAAVRAAKTIHDAWKGPNKRKWRGSLEVRFYETLPYHAYFRADDTFVIGFYYHHVAGIHSEAVQFSADQDVSISFSEHFKKLWEHNEQNALCYIHMSDGFWKYQDLVDSGRLRD